MKRELLLLRHAKSAWDTDAPNDFERPLAKRGVKDAPRVGKWLHTCNLRPDAMVCSPARRNYETGLAVARELHVEAAAIQFDRRLYEAPLSVLQEVVRGLPDAWHRVLVVGHNPGLDNLLMWCCPSAEVEATRDEGKLLTTGAVVRIAVPGNWAQFSANSCRLLILVRPRDLTG